MAGRKKGSKPLPAAELKAVADIKAIQDQVKKQKDEKATDAQKAQIKALKESLGTMRFLRIANKRVPKVIAGIVGLGNFSGAGYTYTEDQAKAITNALETAVEQAKNELMGVKVQAGSFKLD